MAGLHIPPVPGYRAILAARVTLFYCMDRSKATDGIGIYPFSNNYRHILLIPVYHGSMDFSQYAAANYLGIPRQVINPLYTALLTYLVKFSDVLNDPHILCRFNMVERYLMYASVDMQNQMVTAINKLIYERTVQE
jgi:hypothetical protein